jgi:serine-type D-Ala-D-Ala carboxypeptidase/endopeptidase
MSILLMFRIPLITFLSWSHGLGAAVAQAFSWCLNECSYKPYLSAVILGLASPASAQVFSFASEPVDLARFTLGADRGSASAGVLRGELTRFAHVENERFLPAQTSGAIAKTFGEGDQPIYEIGSVSKVFTGLLLAQAVERGEVSLDDSLAVLLKARVTIDSQAVGSISLRQLITHRSCLPRSPPGFGEDDANRLPRVNPYASFTRAQLWMSLRTLKINAQSPCPYAYSNYGIALVGEILADKSGKAWHELVAEAITKPLGMVDTALHPGDKNQRVAKAYSNEDEVAPWDYGAMAPAGGLRSSARDLLIFARALIAGPAGPFGAAAERLLTPLATTSGGEIGYAIFIDGPEGRRTYSHSGVTDGYRTLWAFAPDTQEALVLLASSVYAAPSQVFARVLGSRYPVANTKIDLAPEKLLDYVGVYQISGTSDNVHVVAQDGQLYRRLSLGAFRSLQASAADTFTDPEFGVQYFFKREAGQVVATEIQLAQGVRLAVRSDKTAATVAIVPLSKQLEYVGVFERKRQLRRDLAFDVRVTGGQLAVRSNNFPRFFVYPMSGHTDRFFYEVVKAELQFERDAEGKIVSLTLFQNGGRAKMQKIGD